MGNGLTVALLKRKVADFIVISIVLFCSVLVLLHWMNLKLVELRWIMDFFAAAVAAAAEARRAVHAGGALPSRGFAAEFVC